jgi:hypothetical protein
MIRGFSRFRTVLLVSLYALTVAGCGPADKFPRYKISGKVTHQSKPVEEGTINFEDTTTGQVGSGELGSGGAYSTELPAGSFKVFVTPPQIETKGTPDSPPDKVEKNVANIPKKYRRQETSGLSADVAKDKRTFDFDLKP